MNLYSRARKHIDMSRVKELREEKIKEERIAEVLKQQEELLVELKKIEIKEDSKYSNWRRELNEQMMTTDAIKVTLPPQGNTNLADFTFPVTTVGSSPGYVQSGNDYTFGPASAGVPPAESSSINVTMNSEKYDTIVFDWVNSGVIDKFFAFTGSDGGLNTYNFSTSSGRKEIQLKPSDRKRSVSIAFNIQRNAGGGLGTNKILNVTFQRRTPINVFVGLDSPEANSFMRTGNNGLSAEERKQKLKEQLEAGNEWMLRNGLEPSKTSPGDIELANSLSGPRNSPGEGAVPAYPSPRGPFTPLKNYGTDKNPKLMPSGPPVTPYRLA